MKTNDLQGIKETSMDGAVNVTIIKLHLYISNLIPSVETQIVFNEATQYIYKISYDEFYTERRVISDMIVQHDIGSAQQVNSPNFLICTHQTKDRTSAPDKKNKHCYIWQSQSSKYHVEIDNLRYPRDSLHKN